jgi:hypothetical protein
MRAEVYIRTDRRDKATVLPTELVLVRDGEAGVMKVAEGRARWQPVDIGLRGREVVEVLSGLAAGDVVANPAAVRSGVLRDGRRVRPR